MTVHQFYAQTCDICAAFAAVSRYHAPAQTLLPCPLLVPLQAFVSSGLGVDQ